MEGYLRETKRDKRGLRCFPIYFIFPSSDLSVCSLWKRSKSEVTTVGWERALCLMKPRQMLFASLFSLASVVSHRAITNEQSFKEGSKTGKKKEREKMKVFPPSFLPFLFFRCCRKKYKKNEKFTFVNKMKMVRTIRTIQISRPRFQPRLKVQQNGWNWMQSLLWLHVVSNLELVERFEFLSRPITTNERSCVHVLLLECRMFFKW